MTEPGFTTGESVEARVWDSESRTSPYSTVAGEGDEDFCESCESPVIYDGPADRYGRCNCDEGGAK